MRRWIVVPEANGFGDRSRSALGDTATSTADGCPLVCERGHRNTPAFTDITNAVRIGDSHFCEIHLIKFRFTCHLTKRTNLNAGGVHIERKVGESFVLWRVGVSAGDEHSAAGEVGQRVPDLLTCDDPLVAVSDSAAAESGEI